jgi:hypothetical protein
MTIMELRGLLGLLGKGSFIIFNAVRFQENVTPLTGFWTIMGSVVP